MKTFCRQTFPLLVLISTTLVTPPTQAEPEPTPKIASPEVRHVSLFKNGLAIIQEELPLDNDSGTALWVDPPQFLHGTFWLDTPLPAQVETREVEVPQEDARTSLQDWQNLLAGQEVHVLFRRDTDQRFHTTGIVLDLREQDTLDPNEAILILKKQGGLEFIRTGDIVSLTVNDITELPEPHAPTRKAHALAIAFPEIAATELPETLTVTYLTRGLAWAPSYRIELLDGNQLRLSQAADIRNEFRDLQNVPAALISGFPHVKFSGAESLLSQAPADARSPQSRLESFFRALGQNNNPINITSNVMVQQFEVSGLGLPAMAGSIDSLSQGADLHFQDIPAITLPKDQTLRRELGSGSTQARRLVEWTIPPYQESNGNTARGAQGEEFEPWEILIFNNPLDYPMTTAPAVIFENDRFAGQSLVTWANPGEEARVRVSKALSLATSHRENELLDQRERVEMFGRNYEKLTIDSTFSIRNTRPEPTQILIHHTLDGELLETQGDPETAALPTARDSVNPRIRLTWNFTLDPNAERTITFRYTTLQRR